MTGNAVRPSQMRGTEPIHVASRVAERRDPTAATQALQYISPGMAQVDEWNAEEAIRLAFYGNVIVYRCVQIHANIVGSLPFLAGMHPPKKPGQRADTVDTARLAQLLGPPPGGPAPKLSARRLWSWTVAQRLVTGRHGWEIELTPGKEIAALWPLTSAALRSVPAASGSDWFSHFEYGPLHDPKRLSPDRIVYGWDPSAYDFRQPESALQAARLDISIAVMMDRYNVAFLRNDARPAAVVVTEEFAKDEDFQAFKGQWRGEYGGPDNAGKTAFIEASGEGGPKGAIDVITLGLTQADAQFIEQHRASLERIAIALGVPWSKLDASGRTFDNASEEDHNWWESTLLPRLADLADEVNMQLAPRLGREVGWFDTSGVRALQPPKQFTAVSAPEFFKVRGITVDELRAAADLEALPDGAGNRFANDEEILLFSGRTLPVEPMPLPALPAPVEDVTPPANTARQVEVETRMPEEDREPIDQEARRAKIWRHADSAVRTLEARWQRRMRQLFTQQSDSTIARLEGKRGKAFLQGLEQRASSDGVFDPDYWQQRTREVAEDLYDQVLTAGVLRISDLFAISFDLEQEWARAFVTNRANQLAGNVTDTTYRQIQDTLAEGIAEGEGVPEMAERIRHVFDVASDSRATTIARTEVISAYNGAANLGAQQLPDDVAGGREWISTRDGRTREDHADADGLVVAMDAPFFVGGDALEYPGDPNGDPGNVINCRCTIAFLTLEEMQADGGAMSGQVSYRFAEKLLARVASDQMSVPAALRDLEGAGERRPLHVVAEPARSRSDDLLDELAQRIAAAMPRSNVLKRIERDEDGNISIIREESC